jgi:hypothetical protein
MSRWMKALILACALPGMLVGCYAFGACTNACTEAIYYNEFNTKLGFSYTWYTTKTCTSRNSLQSVWAVSPKGGSCNPDAGGARADEYDCEYGTDTCNEGYPQEGAGVDACTWIANVLVYKCSGS